MGTAAEETAVLLTATPKDRHPALDSSTRSWENLKTESELIVLAMRHAARITLFISAISDHPIIRSPAHPISPAPLPLQLLAR